MTHIDGDNAQLTLTLTIENPQECRDLLCFGEILHETVDVTMAEHVWGTSDW